MLDKERIVGWYKILGVRIGVRMVLGNIIIYIDVLK
jgi:hypothetical protein